MTGLVLCLLLDASSLKDFLEAADRNNTDIRISAEQRSVADATLAQNWTALLPQVTASGSYTRNQYQALLDFGALFNPLFQTFTGAPAAPGTFGPPTFIQKYDQWNGSVRIDLPIVDLARWMKISVARAAADAAEARDAANHDVAHKTVISTYYSYAAALALVQSAEKSRAVAQSQLTLQTARAEAGAVTQLDKLRAQAEVERTVQVAADAQSLSAQTRRALRTLSGLEPDDAIPMPEENEKPEQSFEELERGVGGVGSVRAAEKDALTASRTAAATGYGLFPTIGGQFTELASNSAGFTGKFTQYNAGVVANWHFEVQGTLLWKGQRAQAVASQIQAEKTRLAAADTIHNDWQRFNAALIKIKAARVQVEAARRAQQVANDRYNVGAATQIDVIQADRDVFAAEVSQIQARADLATARLSLRISAGLPMQL